jgi:hypothetical protein
VFVAQLLPLGLGIALRNTRPALIARLEPRVARVGTFMLIAFVILAIVDIWKPVVEAGSRIVLAIVTITWLALGAGHLLGGPDETTCTAVAISSAARNAGVALLVATLNRAAPRDGTRLPPHLGHRHRAVRGVAAPSRRGIASGRSVNGSQNRLLGQVAADVYAALPVSGINASVRWITPPSRV